MKKMLSLAALVMALVMAGCSPFALVNSETYNNADLADYHTFRIVTPDEGRLPPGMAMVTYYNIAAAIREQMLERGFTEDPSSPMLINIGITIHREIQTEPDTIHSSSTQETCIGAATTPMRALSPEYTRKECSPWTS